MQEVPTKGDLRRPLRAARRARPPGERERLAGLIAVTGLKLPALRAAGCVALYASLPDEPGTAPLREALRAQGPRVLLPVVPTAPTGVARRAAAEGQRATSAETGGSGAGSSGAGSSGVGGEHTLYWGVDDGSELTAGAGLGMPEPGGGLLPPSALGEAEVVIVPALAVDARGNRLGKGRGYYDAALRHAAPGALVVALLFDGELLTTPIPAEDHDVPVAGVLTPSAITFF